MSLRSPNLDDRTWDDLLAEARAKVRQRCPAWNDRSVNDPGIVLLEAFAYLTDTMIYRINRLPEKAYIEFLRLLGVQLEPPASATVRLEFTRTGGTDAIEIPRGTRVAVERATAQATPVVFSTLRDVQIAAGADSASVLAIHGELVQGERIGLGTGFAGASFSVRNPPIVAPISDDTHNLIVAVELRPEDQVPSAEVVEWDGKRFRHWTEVENFTGEQTDARVYIVDRATGTITFAPALQRRVSAEPGDEPTLQDRPEALAATPPAGMEIRAWYRRGGGPDGNVQPGTVTRVKDAIRGVRVTNPEPASGGRAVEPLDNALARGPLELRSLRRAVTATDYELGALRAGGCNRAKAFTKKNVWAHAIPGTVSVLLVPQPPKGTVAGQRIDRELLEQQESDQALQHVRQVLEERRPIGTSCEVDWAKFKTLSVKARVVVQRGKDPKGTEERVLRRLRQSLSPIRFSEDAPGWQFGQTLHVSHVYELCLSEPGVHFVDSVRLVVDDAPDGLARAIAADAFQADTWFMANGPHLYRSVNNGSGWERVLDVSADEGSAELVQVATHPSVAGRVVVIEVDGGKSRVHVSRDCGQTWTNPWNPAFEINGVAWVTHDEVPCLMFASDKGLYELEDVADSEPKLIPVVEADDNMGLYSIAAATGDVASLAVAAKSRKGVFLSRQRGQRGTWLQLSGSSGKDLRALAFQQQGRRTWIWAGAVAVGMDKGTGCIRWELGVTDETPVKEPTTFDKNWAFGGCLGLAFRGTRVLAATFREGVAVLDSNEQDAGWRVQSQMGLPLDTEHRERTYLPVQGVAVAPSRRDSDESPLVMACSVGAYRSHDGGQTFEATQDSSPESVTLPPTWLFCSGKHELRVVTEDEIAALGRRGRRHTES